jgi:Ca2+-binding EF-hand superfamily protein
MSTARSGRAGGNKRAAKTYERPGLSEEEIEEIREAFNLFDTDGSGLFVDSFFLIEKPN